jgi:uncharacterized protein
MKIAITGGTGFVGSALTDFFLGHNHEVFILTRKAISSSVEGLHYVQWLTDNSDPEKALSGIDVMINLAGESLNSGRWTEARKEQIFNSRIHSTREVVRILKALDQKPSVFINASAIGFYGTSLRTTFTETDFQHGNDFLAETVWAWEEEAKLAEQYGIRTVLTRFGIILSQGEGALSKIVQPYRFFMGGTVGSGKQWLSWVHIKDVIGLINFAIENNNIIGPLNVTSSYPVTMKEFGQSISKTLGKPHWLPAPSFALKLLLGEMSILVLEGQRVLPIKASKNGYKFSFNSLDEALADVLKS